MERQLALLDNPQAAPRDPARRTPARRPARFQLDERTREVGRRGVAAAREALAEALRHSTAA